MKIWTREMKGKKLFKNILYFISLQSPSFVNAHLQLFLPWHGDRLLFNISVNRPLQWCELTTLWKWLAETGLTASINEFLCALHVSRRSICIDANPLLAFSPPSVPVIPASQACPVRLDKQIGHFNWHCCCNWKGDGLLLGEYFTWAWQSNRIAWWYIQYVFCRKIRQKFLLFDTWYRWPCLRPRGDITPSEGLWIVRSQTLALGENGLWHLAG